VAGGRGSGATTWLGIAITVLVPIIYVPLLAVAGRPSEINTANNYIGDRLLFGGAIFLVAAALPVGSEPAVLAAERS